MNSLLQSHTYSSFLLKILHQQVEKREQSYFTNIFNGYSLSNTLEAHTQNNNPESLVFFTTEADTLSNVRYKGFPDALSGRTEANTLMRKQILIPKQRSKLVVPRCPEWKHGSEYPNEEANSLIAMQRSKLVIPRYPEWKHGSENLDEEANPWNSTKKETDPSTLTKASLLAMKRQKQAS